MFTHALGRYGKKSLALGVALLILVGTFLALSASSADAAPKRCYGWSGNSPAKGAGITLFRGYYDIEWCGVGNRVTEFRVKRCEAGSLNHVFVKNPGSDCRPREALNGSSMRIYGNMWAYSTVSGKIKGIGYKPGPVNIHYEVTLYPDGRIVGTTGR